MDWQQLRGRSIPNPEQRPLINLRLLEYRITRVVNHEMAAFIPSVRIMPANPSGQWIVL